MQASNIWTTAPHLRRLGKCRQRPPSALIQQLADVSAWFAAPNSERQSSGAAVHYFSITHPQINFEVQLHESEKDIAAHLDLDCMIFVGEPSESNLLRAKDILWGPAEA